MLVCVVHVCRDIAVGKNSLLMSYLDLYRSQGLSNNYDPTVQDNITVPVLVSNNVEIRLEIWKPQPEPKELRALAYPHTDVFLVCYSCESQASLTNIRSTWIEEAKQSSNASESGVCSHQLLLLLLLSRGKFNNFRLFSSSTCCHFVYSTACSVSM